MSRDQRLIDGLFAGVSGIALGAMVCSVGYNIEIGNLKPAVAQQVDQITMVLGDAPVTYPCSTQLDTQMVLGNIATHNYTCANLPDRASPLPPDIVQRGADQSYEELEWVFLNINFENYKAAGFRCIVLEKPRHNYYNCVGMTLQQRGEAQPQQGGQNEA